MNDLTDKFRVIGVIRLLGANLLSWISTGAAFQHVQSAVAILAGLGSVGVSIASIMWIRKQAKAFDARHSIRKDG